MTEVRKASARSVEAQRVAEAAKSNQRIKWAAVVLVLVAAGIGIGIYLQGSSADDEAREEMLADARGALRSESTSRDEFSSLSRRFEQFAEQFGATDETSSVHARVLVRMGRYGKAVETIRRFAEEPGASPETAMLGARIFAAQAGRTNDDDLLRRALSMAGSALRTGGPEASAWTVVLAHRLGDLEDFVEGANRLLDQHGSSDEARALRPSLAYLAGQLAEREGWSLAEGSDAPPEASGLRELVRETVPDASDRAGDEPMFPEQLIAAAGVRLSSQSSDGTAGEAVLRSTLEDAQSALEKLPSSIEARIIAAYSIFGLLGQDLASETERSQAKGHLDWLIQNAPPSHGRREQWQGLRARF